MGRHARNWIRSMTDDQSTRLVFLLLFLNSHFNSNQLTIMLGGPHWPYPVDHWRLCQLHAVTDKIGSSILLWCNKQGGPNWKYLILCHKFKIIVKAHKSPILGKQHTQPMSALTRSYFLFLCFYKNNIGRGGYEGGRIRTQDLWCMDNCS